jgi:hypothetical protein
MITEHELLTAVDAAFEITGRGLTPWPDPHPDRSPRGEEYSRLLDPAKWRILGARAEAWIEVLGDSSSATVERNVPVEWPVEPGPVITRTDRLVPSAAGALPLLVARSRLEDIHDAGITLGVGDPPVLVSLFPDCGCDACDSGSQNELDELDRYITGVVSGTFRRLSRRGREITVIGDDGWSARGRFGRGEVNGIIADPNGWDELTGRSWFGPG